VVVRVRMGLHTGAPARLAEGYVGLELHYAARIMSAAHGGQVLLSQTTRDLVVQDIPSGVHLHELGEHRLKDFEHPVPLYQVVCGSTDQFDAAQDAWGSLWQSAGATDRADWPRARGDDPGATLAPRGRAPRDLNRLWWYRQNPPGHPGGLRAA